MPRIIQILDCDSAGHKVRMDDGEFAFLPHDAACVPCIGEELTFDRETGRWSAVEGGLPHMNSGAESKPKGAVEPEQAPAPDNFADTHGLPGYQYGMPVKPGNLSDIYDGTEQATLEKFRQSFCDSLDQGFRDFCKKEGTNAVDSCGGLREGSQGEDPKATPPVV